MDGCGCWVGRSVNGMEWVDMDGSIDKIDGWMDRPGTPPVWFILIPSTLPPSLNPTYATPDRSVGPMEDKTHTRTHARRQTNTHNTLPTKTQTNRRVCPWTSWTQPSRSTATPWGPSRWRTRCVWWASVFGASGGGGGGAIGSEVLCVCTCIYILCMYVCMGHKPNFTTDTHTHTRTHRWAWTWRRTCRPSSPRPTWACA
jgi:hypothetical protein